MYRKEGALMAVALSAPSLVRGRLRLARPQSRSAIVNRVGFSLVIVLTLAVIAVPSVLGMMLGALVGTHVVKVARASVIRNLLIAILVFAGLRVLLKGLGVWI